MIEVKNLVKSYGDKHAVAGISFKANDGEILGFLGPNGAGKSTTMNILTGYLSSTSGEAYINGHDILEDPIAAKKEIGYLPEFPPLYMDMTVKEYLCFVYELRGCRLPRNTHLKEICELVKIDNVYNRRIANLSKGYKQILDEPTVGLDPKQIIEIRTLIKKLGKNHTVILSSHILSEVQAVCDRIVVINQGKIVADDTADNLSRELTADHKLIARIDGPKDEVIKLVQTIPGVVSVVADMQREKGVWEYNIEAVEGTDIRRELNRRLMSRNWYILGLRSSELSLEDIFLKLTMGESVTEFLADKAEDLAEHYEEAEKQ